MPSCSLVISVAYTQPEQAWSAKFADGLCVDLFYRLKKLAHHSVERLWLIQVRFMPRIFDFRKFGVRNFCGEKQAVSTWYKLILVARNNMHRHF